jgi:PAS domain S-box-containing protein
VLVPVAMETGTIGVVTFGLTEGERCFDEPDLAWAQQFAGHVEGLVRDLLAGVEERRLRRQAERAADRMARLQAITSALSRAPGRQQVAAVILRHGEEALGAEAGVLAALDDAGGALEVVRSFAVPSLHVGQSLSLAAELPLTAAARTRTPVVIATAEEIRARFPRFEKVASVRPGGLAALPLIVDGNVVGAFQLCFGEGRHPIDLDHDFLMTIAELAGQAFERARGHDEARRAEARFRLLAETVEQHVWTETPDGRIEYFNQRGRAYLGISDEEASKLDVWSFAQRFADPDAMPGDVSAILEARRAGRPVEFQLRLRRADGVYRRFLVRVVPKHEPDGQVTRWVGTATDVEVLAQVESLLREREAQNRWLSESSILGVGYFGVDGTVTEANPASLAMIGYTPEDLASGSMNWMTMTPPEYATRDAQAAEELVRDGFCRPYEKELLRKDGRRIPVLVGAALLSGSSHTGVGFMIDLTERKRIEREHSEMVDLEQSFRERLMGIVGHDLRNPLSAIMSWVSLLKLSPVLSARDHTAVDRIGRSVERMRRMIEQLLDFTRARRAGGIAIEPSPVDLGAICRAVVEELSSAHPGRLHFDAHGELTGNRDGDRIEQVVSNLAANALQHGGEGMVMVQVAADDGAVRLEVHNSGAPIPAAVLPHLFDPYRRGRSSAPGRTGNLGLGLFIVQQIVQAHGGTIEVTSTATEGTSFIVRLPRREA